MNIHDIQFKFHEQNFSKYLIQLSETRNNAFTSTVTCFNQFCRTEYKLFYKSAECYQEEPCNCKKEM